MPEPTPPTRRRWFRFGLRTLLVFTALVGLLMGWIVKERRQSAREMAIAAELEDEWCHVFVGGPWESVDVNLQWQRIEQGWWQRLAEQALGRRIYGVIKRGSAINVTTFAQMPNVKFIIFVETEVSDLSPLVGLQGLERLTFSNTAVKDLSTLADIKSLKRLDLGVSHLQDLKPLMKMKNLESLRIAFHREYKEQFDFDAIEKALPNCKFEYRSWP